MGIRFAGEAGPPLSNFGKNCGIETHTNAIQPITIGSRIYLPPAAQTAAVTARSPSCKPLHPLHAGHRLRGTRCNPRGSAQCTGYISVRLSPTYLLQYRD